MKGFIISFLTFIFMSIAIPVSANSVDLQDMIDSEKGDTLHIPSGVYVGNFTIQRPITISADDDVILKAANPKEPVLTIKDTKDVSITGITIQTTGKSIQVKDAQNITVSNANMENVYSGIELYRSKNIKIKNNSVLGNHDHYSDKGNAVALFNCENIVVEGNRFNRVQDGVYIESDSDITVRNNSVENSRYGTHFMYSKDAVVEGNDFTHNVTGFMIMMTANLKFSKNNIAYQDGFNGTGITLYDVLGIDLLENSILGNRVGISIQKTSDVQIADNKLQMNQTAVETIRSDESNLVNNNIFVGNLVNVRSDSKGINLQKNYYDDYSGIDIDDDGIGDESYIGLQSFGQWMVRKPDYQYYVEAPSVVLLNEIDKMTNKSERQLLVDESPIVHFQKEKKGDFSVEIWQFLIGLLLLVSSLIVWKRSAL